jgi:hypothetical protein
MAVAVGQRHTQTAKSGFALCGLFCIVHYSGRKLFKITGTWYRKDIYLLTCVEVLELTLYDYIYLVMGARDSKGEAGEP